jgi:predicted GNAT family acetyltransferase
LTGIQQQQFTHILDNVIWNALITGNSNLAEGNETEKYFPPDVGPFAGLKELNSASLSVLHSIIPGERPTVLITAQLLEIPGNWKIVQEDILLQMVCSKPGQFVAKREEIISLDKKDIPAMIELTRLTNPGPFLQRTIEFGNYKGIFKSNKLVAMAGQRMHAENYLEVSAVCTHPDYLENGYSTALILQLVHEYIEREQIPFLHVRANNTSAIKLYEKLGFVTRQHMNFAVIKKE